MKISLVSEYLIVIPPNCKRTVFFQYTLTINDIRNVVKIGRNNFGPHCLKFPSGAINSKR